MSMQLQEIRTVVAPETVPAIETGTVQATRGQRLTVLLPDGRERICWGNIPLGASVVIQGDKVIARGRQGRVLIYDV